MISGVALALTKIGFSPPGHQTAIAAPAPMQLFKGVLPLDLQLDAEKRQIHDTITIRDTVTVINTIRKKVRIPSIVTDTLVAPMHMPVIKSTLSVNNQTSGVREEQTPVLLLGSKSSNITLTVDGQVVYKTKNDIHSTEDRQ